MSEEQPRDAAVTSARQQEDYEQIEAALHQMPRGRWFLAEYARRNRNADTALVLAAIERLEQAVKAGEGERPTQTPPEAPPKTAAATPVLPFAQLKQDVKIAAEDIAAIEQAAKDAAADILMAAEAIQDFTWQMRDKGIDRAVCETIERHTADIYSACSFPDTVYQRKENARHLLRLIAEAIEAAIADARHEGDQEEALVATEGVSGALVSPSASSDPEEAQGMPLPEDLAAAEDFPVRSGHDDARSGTAFGNCAPASADEEMPGVGDDEAPPLPHAEEQLGASQAGRSAPETAVGDDDLATRLDRLDSTRLGVLFG